MDLATVLAYLCPNSQWNLNGDTYNGLEWIGPGKAPTEKECLDAWNLIKADFAKRPIQEHRREAFIKESDPLFFAVQRGEIDHDVWLDKVQEIRNRFPYPE
jgi:hypothetical protein